MSADLTSKWAFDRNPLLRWVHGRRLATDLALVRRFGGRDRRLLDYGCGDGHILRGAADAYGRVVGVDAIDASLAGIEVHGLPSNATAGHVRNFHDVVGPHAPFNTASFLQVLEHVADPERGRILDAVDGVTTPDAVYIVEVPIESGPMLVAKVLVRWLLKLITRGRYTPERYSLRELLSGLSVRGAPHVRPPHPESPQHLGTNGFGHKGFSVWALRQFLAERYELVEERFLPFNALHWINLQAVFVCRKRP